MVRDRVDHEAPVTRQRMTPCSNPTAKINLIPYNEILKNRVANDIRQSISSGTPNFFRFGYAPPPSAGRSLDKRHQTFRSRHAVFFSGYDRRRD
ncbi:hypothetical protein OWT26_13865 [Burkholderia sp. 1A5]